MRQKFQTVRFDIPNRCTQSIRFSPVFFRRTVGKHAEKEYFMRCLLFYLWVFVSSQEIRNDAFAFATASRFALYGGA